MCPQALVGNLQPLSESVLETQNMGQIKVRLHLKEDLKVSVREQVREQNIKIIKN